MASRMVSFYLCSLVVNSDGSFGGCIGGLPFGGYVAPMVVTIGGILGLVENCSGIFADWAIFGGVSFGMYWCHQRAITL